ncbi:hypothetical protein HRTV-25_gp88 [Halorubrum tailed virus 25]|uniref:Uncharacterized protein n=1 Tax=Halorubrum tailed virus 25 TaxID=2878006 RepID=A0AAE8XZW6_9CAUD|nr:hypothetical protein M1M37_gp088 [Halorubrum tailed virus 25]UBF22669.1 hypothetical protein HRTV-25_gp88 [Halorubrum tailed virus 25]
MSQTKPNQPDPRFDYENMMDSVALSYLAEDFGHDEVKMWLDRNHIISPTDVLYYADVYGDLEDAILLQSWDKSLPSRAHRGLLDSGYDIFEAVNNHDLEKERCPCCDADMWRFEIRHGEGYTQTEWVDEWGNVTDDFVEFVSDVESRFWNAEPEDDHAPILCPACSHDIGYDFPTHADQSGSVRVHYGETDEISGFSVKGNLVRWDFEAYFGDEMTDLWGLPGGHEDGLAKALASGSLAEWLEDNNWTEIALKTAKDAAPSNISTRTFHREYKRIASEWAKSDETHPDLDFTYVIDFSTFGHPSFFVAEENEAALLAEINDLIERRHGQ